MAKWENLKIAVAAVVKTNGNEEITGANMQTVLNSIINAVGGNAGFAGIATPTTNPSGIPDGPTFYIATQGGTYSYFPTDGQSTPATIQDGVISVLYNQGNGCWSVTITPVSIADGSVTNAKLANGVVTNDKIADGTIDGYLKIAESSIRWENMDQGSVGKDTLQDDAVIESKIKDGAVTEYKLGTSSVSTRSIKDGAVTTNKLYNGAITGEKIADGTIDNEKIADSGIRTENLENECVTTEKLAPFAVDTGNIENKAVTKGKLDDDVAATLDEVDNKANIDGFYDTMGVGTARNLLGKTSIVDTFFHKTIGVGVAKGNGYVDGVRGNSVAWRQLVQSLKNTYKTVAGVVFVYDEFGKCTVSGTATSSGGRTTNLTGNSYALHTNHKYYITAPLDRVFFSTAGDGYITEVIVNKAAAIFTYTDIEIAACFMCVNAVNGTTYTGSGYFQLIDLTSLEIDNLTTTEEVEAWLAANVGKADYYDYNAGELLSAKMASLKTVGFNRWDGALESGYWDTADGSAKVGSNWRRSANPIKVLPDTDYFIYSSNPDGYGATLFYDGQMNYLGSLGTSQSILRIIRTPADCCFIHFYAGTSFGFDTLCINLSNSALNGTYMPYMSKTKQIPCTTLTGNHLGTRSTIFPDGMKSAGSVHDELVIEGGVAKAIKRVGSVDLGDLTWSGTNERGKVTSQVVTDAINIKSSIPVQNILCPKYMTSSARTWYAAETPCVALLGAGYGSAQCFGVVDTALANKTPQEIQAALDGVLLFYELATPIEYTDLMDEEENDFSLPIGIEVEPLGTLETLPQNTEGEALTMCAPMLLMQFSIDAAKILTDELPNEYRTNTDDKADWNKFLAIINEKLGGTMGGTISVDDAAVGHGLDFTFAAAQAENNRNVEPIEE